MSTPMRNPDGTMVDPNFFDRPGGFGFFPRRPSGDSGGSATGEVGNITSAAGRAGEYLSTAGEAIGQGSRRGMVYKKGGKVKKKKKNPTIKVRGAGKVIKGVRPAKMVKMKGS